MNTDKMLQEILLEILSIAGDSPKFTRESPLLNAVPELDSMKAMQLLLAIEERFEIMIDDEAISSDLFTTYGSLLNYIEAQL